MFRIRQFTNKHRYLFLILAIGVIAHLGVSATLKTLALKNPDALHSGYPVIGGGFDAFHYDRLSDNLLKHRVFSLEFGEGAVPETFRTPAYPLFVAFVKLVTGSVEALPIFQIILLAGSAILAYGICLLVAPGYKKVALLTSLFFLFDPVSFFSSQFIATEALYTFLFLVCVYFILKDGARPNLSFAIAGIFFGLSALTRPSGLLMIIPIGIWFLWHLLFPKSELRKQIFISAVVFFLASATVLAPWIIRNGEKTGVYAFSSLSAYNPLNFNLPVYLSYKSNYEVSIEEARADLHQKIGNISDKEQLDLKNSPIIKEVVWETLKPDLFEYAFFHAAKSANFFWSPGSKLDASFLKGFFESQPTEDWNTKTSIVNSIMDGRFEDAFLWLKQNILFLPESIFLLCLFFLGLFWVFVSRSHLAGLIVVFVLFMGLLTSPISNPRYRAPIVSFIYFSGFMGAAVLVERWKKRASKIE